MQETKIFHIKPLQSGTRLNFTKTRDDDENTVIVKQLSGYGKFMADLKTSLTLFRDGLAAVKFAEVMIDGLVVQKFSEMIFDTQQLYYERFGYTIPDAAHHAWDLYAPILEKLINTYLTLFQIDKWSRLSKNVHVVM